MVDILSVFFFISQGMENSMTLHSFYGDYQLLLVPVAFDRFAVRMLSLRPRRTLFTVGRKCYESQFQVSKLTVLAKKASYRFTPRNTAGIADYSNGIEVLVIWH